MSARLSILNAEAVEEVLHIQELIENLNASQSKRKEKLNKSASTKPLQKQRPAQDGRNEANLLDQERDDILDQLEELEKLHRER